MSYIKLVLIFSHLKGEKGTEYRIKLFLPSRTQDVAATAATPAAMAFCLQVQVVYYNLLFLNQKEVP